MPFALKNDKTYTYADYLTWPETERWEIIDGCVYAMSPAPNRFHQEISAYIFTELYSYLKDYPCKAYHAPFDVRFSEKKQKNAEINNVVQPDISVICDTDKLDDRGCIGAPDLIIEILSPATAAKDVKEKFSLYEKHGVKEYWIIHPDERIVQIFSLNKKDSYGRPAMYSFEDEIPVGIFNNLMISMQQLTAD